MNEIKCFLCDTFFESPRKLFEHIKNYALPSNVVHKCTYTNCFQQFYNKSSYKRHVLRHFKFKQYLYNRLKEQDITIDVLKILKAHHISKLFNDLSVGDQAKFENCLEKWKETSTPFFKRDEIQLSSDSSQKSSFVSVKEILSNTFNGKEILKFYSKNDILHEEQRNLLISTVAKYIEANGIPYTISDCADIEKQISNIFLSEQLYLRLPTITVDEFDLYWRKCARYRLKQISESKSTAEIFQMWPEYKKPSGSNLINIDFELKFPFAKQFSERWLCYKDKVIYFLQSRISNLTISKKMQQIHTFNEESVVLTVLWNIHHLFPPTQKVTSDMSGAKIRKKFSVLDSQESFAILAESEEEIEIKLKLLMLQGRNIQPKLLISGNLEDIKSIFVYFDGNKDLDPSINKNTYSKSKRFRDEDFMPLPCIIQSEEHIPRYLVAKAKSSDSSETSVKPLASYNIFQIEKGLNYISSDYMEQRPKNPTITSTKTHLTKTQIKQQTTKTLQQIKYNQQQEKTTTMNSENTEQATSLKYYDTEDSE
ncbi:hypothetical protein FF38_12920 [Lucilia cuprina]|uniref:C2H2-type domain-containing protein n=1 Tax=Lucilia cuprina TaxID=7375 RepID=A0A0L0CJ53_LUCCU|nr:hypothetical protein FF38_12920 [Lucilia cuprina]